MDEKEALLEKWDEIKLLTKEEHDILDVPFETWILPLKIHSVHDGIVQIMISRELETGISYISNKYKLPLKVTISQVMKRRYDVEFIPESKIENFGKQGAGSGMQADPDKSRNSNLNSKYTFDTFVVGSNNRMAHSAALAVAEDPGKVYNPLFIYGEPGLGKTHLMHSIGHYIMSRNPDIVVRYFTSEYFTNEVIESIRLGPQSMSKLREKYRSVDVLLLDDIQFIIGKESTQNEFFNTFNELHSQNKAIILSSDRPPKKMETLEARMKSRFDWGLTVDIGPPDYETRMAILRRYADSCHVNFDDEVIQYIAQEIRSNIRELEGALNKLILIKNVEKEEITVDIAKEAVKEIASSDGRRVITPEMILEEISKFYRVSADDIKSKKKSKDIVLPRQVAMYIIREKTDCGLAEIGKFLGNRDHTTVLYGHDKIVADMAENPALKEDLNEILKKLSPN